MPQYIHRELSSKITESIKLFPVVGITGPRQSGKTSLCRHLFPDYTYVNLEDILYRAAALQDPVNFVNQFGSKVIFDEVQNVPELFSMIQTRVDEDPERRFILTGSCNFTLMRRISQSLAGRIALFTLLPFSFSEMSREIDLSALTTPELMVRGQYPRIVMSDASTNLYYSSYYQTYIERDVRDLLNIKYFLKFDKFVRLMAARVGSEFNASAISREVGVSSPTISEWLSILSISYIVYSVQPYSGNLSKRLTKMPKIYFYDTGLLCYLLTLDNKDILEKSPQYGAIFENLAMGELMKQRINKGERPELYFYRETSGKEVDALVNENGKINLYEIKSGKTFKTEYTANMELLARKLPNAGLSTVICDAPSLPPLLLNIRNI